MSSYSSDLDRALDGLGFSYIDGVPFRLDPRIESVSSYDYSRVDELLQRPLPNSELSNMCTLGIIAKVTPDPKQYISNIFCRHKSSGGLRIILDLSFFNEEVEYKHFKMHSLETVSLVGLY